MKTVNNYNLLFIKHCGHMCLYSVCTIITAIKIFDGKQGQGLSPPVKKILTVPRQHFFCGSFMFFFLSCVCYAFLHVFICALWSPAGKGLTSLLSFVMSNCEFVTFPFVSWSGVVLDCIDS